MHIIVLFGVFQVNVHHKSSEYQPMTSLHYNEDERGKWLKDTDWQPQGAGHWTVWKEWQWPESYAVALSHTAKHQRHLFLSHVRYGKNVFITPAEFRNLIHAKEYLAQCGPLIYLS